jgi:hypothetical protein
MQQMTKPSRTRRPLLTLTLFLAAALALSLTAAPAFAAVSTDVLRLPTADVLPPLRLALQAGLPFDSTVQSAAFGLPGGLMIAASVPPGGLDSHGLTAELRYRLLEGSLVTPAVAVGTTYNTKSQAFSPYAVLTKGILNAKVTAGVHLDQLASGAANPVFAGVDLDVFGPLHALAEYDGGQLRYGARFSFLNADVKAYLEGTDVKLTGRLVLPF